MKLLIVGLGNPGAEYQFTRHNIGFEVLDALAGVSNIFFSPARLGDVCTLKHKGRSLILLKPNTYMNLSGKALNYWMQEEKIPVDRVLVITDDLSLPFGKIRLRGAGSDGGHNGLKSIQAILGHNNYARLRFGIGSDFPKGAQVNYVLSKWNAEEQQQLKERIQIAAEAVLSFAAIGLPQTMTQFNSK
jgi:PTH1 family peptidyl-tRNA hydrolase